MIIEFVTKDDLERFRKLLIEDLTVLILSKRSDVREWLRCSDVRQMLNISTGTLQNLRINGHLKSKKVGGIHFYRRSEIDAMLGGGK